MNCPSCNCGMARSLQVRRGSLRPYPEGYLTCCNPACRLVVNTANDDQYHRGKKIGLKRAKA